VAAVRWFGFVAGLALVGGTGLSLLYTLIVPRGHTARAARLATVVAAGLGRTAGDRRADYRSQDRVLAVVGPLALLGLFTSWLLLFMVGFALILWPLVPGGLGAALRQAGSSLFTLGLASSPRGSATTVDYAAAATGLLAIALEIAYLPTIYGAFNRRETLVTLLEGRAGSPAWGPEVLARHQLVGITGSLPAFYAAWEQWAADLAETHSNYTVLMHFRSPHPMRSWIVALLAVLDSAALYQALSPAAAPSESRLCLRMGFTCLRELARVQGLPYDPDPMPNDPVELTYDEFLAGVARIRETGFPIERSPEEAWVQFRGWRVNYEAIAWAIADLVTAVAAPWSGPRRRIGELQPLRPLDRTPDDPAATRHAGGRWQGPATLG